MHSRSCFRTPFGSQRANGSQTLQKSARALSGPRNVYIFYEFLLKRAGRHTVVYVYYLEVLLMPTSYTYK